MPPILTIKNVSKSYGVRTILKNASFVLQEGEKIALVGANGVGKSTLLKIISGSESYNDGTIELRRGASIGYLRQEFDLQDIKNTGDYLAKVLGAKSEDFKIKKRSQLLFGGFGLQHITQKSIIAKMSGGEKSKLALIGLLLEDAHILLLDEPTNNLDLPALIWLEEYLRESRKSAIIVSHDRRFLDDLVARVLEIDWFGHEVISFVGNHTEFIAYKEMEFLKQKYAYEKQEQEKKTLKLAIQKKKENVARNIKKGMPDNDKMASGYHQNRATQKLSSQTKALLTRIGRLTGALKPMERAPLSIEISNVSLRTKPSIHLLKASGGYKNFNIGPITIEIPFGRRVGILGRNGSGKSTLLKMLSGSKKLKKGEFKIGPTAVFGNLTQAHENLSRDKNLIEFLEQETKLEQEFIFNILQKYGFSPTEAKKAISELSPGGRARLIVAAFSMRSVNMLILDEPTNHLDEDALDALRELLITYKGTVILVSHDRAFLSEARMDYIYVLEKGILKQIPGVAFYEEKILSDIRKSQELLKFK